MAALLQGPRGVPLLCSQSCCPSQRSVSSVMLCYYYQEFCDLSSICRYVFSELTEPRSKTQDLQLPLATPWTQGIVPFVSNLTTKRRELQLHTLGALLREKELPLPLGGQQSRSGRFGELSLASTGFRTPDHPASSRVTARIAPSRLGTLLLWTV